MSNAAKAINKEVKRIELSTKGQNWGVFSVKRTSCPALRFRGWCLYVLLLVGSEGGVLALESDAASVFELPLSLVQQSVVQGKNEVRNIQTSHYCSSLDNPNN